MSEHEVLSRSNEISLVIPYHKLFCSRYLEAVNTVINKSSQNTWACIPAQKLMG